MERSLASVKALREEKGIPIDRAADPNATGIIGDEFSPLTTSVGDVEAKRTAANPAFAAVMVGYFRRAGLRAGDVVAVGASGSFPAFALATLSAARVLDLRPVVVGSVGASMYGANLPGFTLVDMLGRLRSDGLLPYRLAAVSPGGDDDGGRGVLFDESGDTLMAETRRSGLPMVRGRDTGRAHSGSAADLPRRERGSAHPLLRQHRRLGGQLRHHGRLAGAAARPDPASAGRAVVADARGGVRVRRPRSACRAPAVREGTCAGQWSVVRPDSAPSDRERVRCTESEEP